MVSKTETVVSTEIHASTNKCYEIVTNFEDYPEWVDGVISSELLPAEAENPIVKFEAESFGRKISYTLQYDMDSGPNTLSWVLVESDVLSYLKGSYTFEESDPGVTRVTYSLSLDLSVTMPGFIRRRAEDKIVHSALMGLKTHVENS